MLVDWNMPEMNGLELVRAMRATPNLADIPLVMVTTEGEAERICEAITAGANEYVMKPFDREAITGKLQLIGVL
jgi:two-component system chemotaxis response regulator CheY